MRSTAFVVLCLALACAAPAVSRADDAPEDRSSDSSVCSAFPLRYQPWKRRIARGRPYRPETRSVRNGVAAICSAGCHQLSW